MRFHLFIVFITHKFRASKKLMAIRGGGRHLWAWKFRQEGKSNRQGNPGGRGVKNLALCRRSVHFVLELPILHRLHEIW